MVTDDRPWRQAFCSCHRPKMFSPRPCSRSIALSRPWLPLPTSLIYLYKASQAYSWTTRQTKIRAFPRNPRGNIRWRIIFWGGHEDRAFTFSWGACPRRHATNQFQPLETRDSISPRDGKFRWLFQFRNSFTFNFRFRGFRSDIFWSHLGSRM